MAEYAEVIVMDNTQHPTFLFVHSNDESKNYQCSMEIDEENSEIIWTGLNEAYIFTL